MTIDRDYITRMCNSLPMVEWDRTVEVSDYFGDDTDYAVVFGWIADHEKNRHDFVALQFWWNPSPGCSYLTSSAHWSEKINDIITPDDEHNACQPVQANLPDILQAVPR